MITNFKSYHKLLITMSRVKLFYNSYWEPALPAVRDSSRHARTSYPNLFKFTNCIFIESFTEVKSINVVLFVTFNRLFCVHTNIINASAVYCFLTKITVSSVNDYNWNKILLSIQKCIKLLSFLTNKLLCTISVNFIIAT